MRSCPAQSQIVFTRPVIKRLSISPGLGRCCNRSREACSSRASQRKKSSMSCFWGFRLQDPTAIYCHSSISVPSLKINHCFPSCVTRTEFNNQRLVFRRLQLTLYLAALSTPRFLPISQVHYRAASNGEACMSCYAIFFQQPNIAPINSLLIFQSLCAISPSMAQGRTPNGDDGSATASAILQSSQ